MKAIRKLTLWDLLYQIKLDNNVPLFLQLGQRSTGEADAVIPNTPKAELMAKRMNVQIAVWCFFYWKEKNPGAERFYQKLSDRAFNQVLLHKIKECTWDSSLKAVSLPKVQSEAAEIADFEQQDWVRQLAQEKNQGNQRRSMLTPTLLSRSRMTSPLVPFMAPTPKPPPLAHRT